MQTLGTRDFPAGRKVMLQYAAKLTPGLPQEGGYTVTFRDVPEAITEGERWVYNSVLNYP